MKTIQNIIFLSDLDYCLLRKKHTFADDNLKK